MCGLSVIVVYVVSLVALAENKPEAAKEALKSSSETCILPPYPEHGVYEVAGNDKAKPGEGFETILLTYMCSDGYSLDTKNNRLFCIDGTWSNEFPKCGTECGKLNSVEHVTEQSSQSGLPWHAGVYRSTTRPYAQICGGSIVSTKAIISAAHCFWTQAEKLLPASDFVVAVGKFYKSWDHENDTKAQKYEVSEINIPPRFFGSAKNFQDDIAIVIIKTPIAYNTFVRPVCLDFDYNFDRRQLQAGNYGKVGGWNLKKANAEMSSILLVLNMPYIDINECLGNSPPSFREFITSDKICAGYTNGTTLCKGDSGGGLSFPEIEDGVEKYYLRGIVSTAPSYNDQCIQRSYTSFTQVAKHEEFIRKFLK